MFSLPFLMIGSLFLLIANLPIESVSKVISESGIGDVCSQVYSSTFSLMAFFTVIGITYSYLKNDQVITAINGALTGLAAFILLTPSSKVLDSGESVTGIISKDWTAGQGMICAILIGFLVGYIYSLCVKKDISIKIPDGVPSGVADSFSSLLPTGIIITICAIIYAICHFIFNTTFAELIKISGLSHGTDVWLNNGQELVNQGIVTLSEAIGCRDDIMLYLIKKGLPPKPAFKIMEFVRKGKASKDPEKWKEHEAMMREYNIPEWYIGSCQKIKYMFPKAHAAAYVTNAFRIAWFKVHKPAAYYTAFYTIRADEFDSDIMCYGVEKVKNKMKEIDLQGNSASTKDKNMYAILELVLEMYERGITFLPIDLYKSHATKFIMESDTEIRPPLNSIPGLGTVAAEGIDTAKKDGKFMSIDDMKIRSKIGASVVEMLQKVGCLKGMSQSNQLSLFG